MKHFNNVEEYRNQPFEILYKPENIKKVHGGLATTDGKYFTSTDSKGFSYWHGKDCFYNTAYGYFFICGSDMMEKAAENLNKTLDKDYEFNPLGIGKSIKS